MKKAIILVGTALVLFSLSFFAAVFGGGDEPQPKPVSESQVSEKVPAETIVQVEKEKKPAVITAGFKVSFSEEVMMPPQDEQEQN